MGNSHGHKSHKPKRSDKGQDYAPAVEGEPSTSSGQTNSVSASILRLFQVSLFTHSHTYTVKPGYKAGVCSATFPALYPGLPYNHSLFKSALTSIVRFKVNTPILTQNVSSSLASLAQ
jgi:hypothetical protein